MNNLFRAIIMTLGVSLLAGCAQGTATPAVVPATQTAPAIQATSPMDAKVAPGYEALVPVARSFVDQMAAGDFASAVSRFDDTMKTAMPEEKLKATWQQLVAQVGAFKQQTGTQTLDAQSYRVVLVACEFATTQLYTQITFDSQSKIAGLFFAPMQAPTVIK